MEKAKFPMPTMTITQGYNVGSHAGAFALDLGGEDSGIDWVLAPFTGTVKAVRNDAQIGIWYWFESNEPVLCANGEITKLTVMFGHDNRLRHQVGDVVAQGANFCAEGQSGQASGNHCHMEVAYGPYSGNNWHQNYAGKWMIDNPVKPNDVLCVPDNYVIRNDGGLLWKKESEVVQCDQTLRVGSKVRINKILTVTAVDAANNLIAIQELTGTPENAYHWFDPTPFYNVDSTGCLTQSQVCTVGCKVKLDGEFTVQSLARTEAWACKITIGGRTNWVWTEPCVEVAN